MGDLSIRLRPLVEGDLLMLRRFVTEPGPIGLDWAGFRDAQAPGRRFAVDGYLGTDDGRLIVEVEQKALVKAGFQLEGVVRAAEFRAGRWRDAYLYSRLRDDRSPALCDQPEP